MMKNAFAFSPFMLLGRLAVYLHPWYLVFTLQRLRDW